MKIAAGDSGFTEKIREMAESVQGRFRYHSIALPDGTILPGLQTIEHLQWRLGLFGLPEDLTGKRVLDIGAWDGWFSFECERRGADVVAVDCVRLDTFLEAHRLRNSNVEYLELDVSELSPKRLGTFDIVLFFGVLYHLRHPLLGLEKVVELSTDLALVESYVIPDEGRAVIEFYEKAELGGQIDNWCGPSPEALLALCRSAGFAQVDLKDVTSQRASVLCNRRWPAPGFAAAPHLVSVVNSRTYRASFHSDKDEYLSCYFKAEFGDVMVEVDGFGTQTLSVSSSGPGAFQANCLRPPGLSEGRHEVRIRTPVSALSNAAAITMGEAAGHSLTLPEGEPELCSFEQSAADRRTSGAGLTCYFRSPAEALLPADISIDNRMPDTVSALGDGVWQANLLLDKPLPEGTTVSLRYNRKAPL